MALVELMEKGFLKHIISQNVDGLHRKSGIPAEKISEVHGNTNLEICDKCGTNYMRDFRVRNAQKVKDHRTGRRCDNKECGGELHDSIINFGESLKTEILDQGYDHAQIADLMVVMGSSLRVNPAAHMASCAGRSRTAKLVIINLQVTPHDDIAELVIHGKMEDVMTMLMKELNIKIPQFTLKRWAKVSLTTTEKGDEVLSVNGITPEGGAYDLFKNVSINGK